MVAVPPLVAKVPPATAVSAQWQLRWASITNPAIRFWMAAPKFDGRKCKAADTEGVCIARMSKHYCAVVEGVPQDTFDSSQKMIYGIWVHEINH